VRPLRRPSRSALCIGDLLLTTDLLEYDHDSARPRLVAHIMVMIASVGIVTCFVAIAAPAKLATSEYIHLRKSRQFERSVRLIVRYPALQPSVSPNPQVRLLMSQSFTFVDAAGTKRNIRSAIRSGRISCAGLLITAIEVLLRHSSKLSIAACSTAQLGGARTPNDRFQVARPPRLKNRSGVPDRNLPLGTPRRHAQFQHRPDLQRVHIELIASAGDSQLAVQYRHRARPDDAHLD
jgi:hypothetical protein